MVQPQMDCEGAGSYFAMAQVTVTKACKLLTPHWAAAEWAVGCVPELPGQLAIPGGTKALPSLLETQHGSQYTWWEEPERSVPVSSLGEVRSAPSG